VAKVARAITLVVLLAFTLVVAGCGDQGDADVPGMVKEAVAATSPSVSIDPANALSTDETDQVRTLAFAYWAAWNSYDLEKVFSLLDEPFRTNQAEQIENDLGRIKFWHVTLGMSEVNPPQRNAGGEVEMYLNMKEPTGTRLILMKFVKTGSSWLVKSTEEVGAK